MSVKRSLKNGITVEELMDQLSNLDPKSKIVFSYNFGDHTQSTVCEPVRGVEEGKVFWSEYHRMLRQEDPDRDGVRDDDTEDVAVINLQ